MTPFGLGVRAIAAYNVYRYLDLRIEGKHFLPASGPAVIAARHYHHLFDGAALVHGLPRQPHIFVALDWASSRWDRLVMETACNLANWPVALRGESLDGSPSAYTRGEALRYVKRSVARGVELLRRGEVLAVFPEGYPTIDPVRPRKPSDDAFLPFRPGLLAIAAQAGRVLAAPIPIVPAGFAYERHGERFQVTLRLGPPLYLRDGARRSQTLATLETSVRELSR